MKHLIICLFLFPFPALAQQKGMVWDYPIKPGMEKWQKFESVDEMYQACQIPDNVLKQLSTESLVDICLNFPAPPLFALFNYPQQAFIDFYSNFNGIRELFQRKDAGLYLSKRYASMSLSDFNPLWQLHRQSLFISHYKFVEAILSQPQVIASLDVKSRKALLKEATHKMDEKFSRNDLFSGFSIGFNLWVIGNLLYSENRSSLASLNQEILQTALKTGTFAGIEVDLLYNQAKKYAYENE